MSVFIIPDPIYARIMACMGFPITNEEDLGVEKDFIVDTLIGPALLAYYKYFPIKQRQIFIVDMEFEIDYPDDSVIGITDCRINSNVLGGGTHVMNPLVNEMNITIASGAGNRGMFGTPNDYGYTQVRYGKALERQGVIENARTFQVVSDENARKIIGFTNIMGRLNVTWARMSYDWKDISFRRQEEVIQMAQVYVLEYFGGIRKQASSQLPVEMSGDDLLEKAEKLKEKITEIWESFPKVVIIRS